MHSPFPFLIFVMIDSRDISYSFEVLKNFWMSICLFILFLSLMHLLMHVLISFSLCFSPLCVFLLTSMSLRISASLTKMSSLTFAAADAVARDSWMSFLISLVLLLEWNTIDPDSSPGCGSRAPRCSSALRSRCSSPFFAVVRHASSSSFSPSIRCGRCFGSRSPASSSQPPLPPQVNGVDVQPSWRQSSLPCLCFQFLVLLLRQVCDLLLMLLRFLFQLVLFRPSFFLCFSFFCGGFKKKKN